MKKIKIILIGFGNVGQEFAGVLLERRDKFLQSFNCEFTVVAIATARRGALFNQDGIDLEEALVLTKDRGGFSADHPDYSEMNPVEIIRSVEADIVIELSTLNIESGEPAITHIRTAFETGKHVITTNKGPIAHAYEDLRRMADEKGRFFLFEGTVMDGAPIFNLVRETMMGCEITGVRGIFNGTTNYILAGMEKGSDFETVLKEAQDYGWAEADPSMDVDGWDAAAKTAALMNVLMHVNIKPADVACQGIRHITSGELQDLKSKGKTIKLVCEGFLENGKPAAKVAPTVIPLTDPLASVTEGSTAVTIISDFLQELTILIKDPSIRQTAYAVVIDLLTIVRSLK